MVKVVERIASCFKWRIVLVIAIIADRKQRAIVNGASIQLSRADRLYGDIVGVSSSDLHDVGIAPDELSEGAVSEFLDAEIGLQSSHGFV